jgi:hypothetical protein
VSFYALQAPTAWAEPPATWSSTSFDDADVCPRRWQLLRSRWGDFERFPVRPHPAAVEGLIVHEALDRLTRSCGRRGNPAIGTSEFSLALADADFFPGFARALTDWHQRLVAHPRPGHAFRLRASSEDLANRAVRMFRESYKATGPVPSQPAARGWDPTAHVETLLRCKRALSEVKLAHPKLPFVGVLDRVQVAGEGVEIVDFKTGKPSDMHRTQLLRYALLWWRNTGDLPVRVIAQHLGGVGSWPVTPRVLEEVEAELEYKIPILALALAAHPAPAKPGPVCQSCAVRARCAPGWAAAEETGKADGRGDAELVVLSKASHHGFLARSRTDGEIAVVYEAPIGKVLPPDTEGQVLRVVDGVWRASRTQLELMPWTEVFIMNDGRC